LKPLLITPGDPDGVGPEVTLRALGDGPLSRPVILIGDATAIDRAAEMVGIQQTVVPYQPGQKIPEAGLHRLAVPDGPEPVEVQSIRMATEMCLEGVGCALVTGPIHKEKLARRGFGFPGHTDFLGDLCGVAEPVMAFVGKRLRVALVTVHCPVKEVSGLLNGPKIQRVLRCTSEAFQTFGGIQNPRLLVCGLNPHAGDGGLLGSEDQEIIAPAVAAMDDLNLIGPISAEAAFLAAMRGDGDVVVAMYHDQGLAPLKAVEFGQAVNWTLGLPIVRTSVDHGTAYDIAWQGVADAGSMRAAIEWALHCVDCIGN